jgi:anti-sigma factor RsiW
MRDLLPDFVHGKLDSGAAAAVASHISVCDACAAEVELLQALRGVLEASAPRVNTDLIAQSVLRRTTSTKRVRGGRWTGAALLAIAASVALAALMIRDTRGGASTEPAPGVAAVGIEIADSVVAQSDERAAAPALPVDSEKSTPPGSVSPAPEHPTPNAPVMKLASAQLPVGGSLRDLDEADLERLLDQIDAMQALPSLSPDPTLVTTVEVPQ